MVAEEIPDPLREGVHPRGLLEGLPPSQYQSRRPAPFDVHGKWRIRGGISKFMDEHATRLSAGYLAADPSLRRRGNIMSSFLASLRLMLAGPKPANLSRRGFLRAVGVTLCTSLASEDSFERAWRKLGLDDLDNYIFPDPNIAGRIVCCTFEPDPRCFKPRLHAILELGP